MGGTRGKKRPQKTPEKLEHRIEFTGELPPTPPRFEGEKDWFAWKHTLDARDHTGLTARTSVPTPTAAALEAINFAANGGTTLEARWAVTADSLKLAGILTVRFAPVYVWSLRLGPGRYDCFIDALNRYPHPDSTACRWLLPALRNLVNTEQRESPEELFGQWAVEHHRLEDLTLHRWSPRFQGQPPQHAVRDCEDISHMPPAGRSILDAWRTRAHIWRVPRSWNIQHGACTDPMPPLHFGRLNALVRYVVKSLKYPSAKVYKFEEAGVFIRFLLTGSQDPDLAIEDRRRFRDCLVSLNDALVQGLAKRYPLRLHQGHVDTYDRILRLVRGIWKRKRPEQSRDELIQDRRAQLELIGWRGDLVEIAKRLAPDDLATCQPARAAAMLFCMQEEFPLHHRQTIIEQLAEVRKGMNAMDPSRRKQKRRGRPPKSKNI